MMITPQQRRRRGVRGYQRVRGHRSLPRRTPLTTGDASNKARRECVPLRTTPPQRPSTRVQHRRLDLALAFSPTPGYPPTRAPLTSAQRALLGLRAGSSVCRFSESAGAASPRGDETFQPIRGRRLTCGDRAYRIPSEKKTFFVSSAYGQCPCIGANFFLHFSDDNWHPDCRAGAERRQSLVPFQNIAAVF